MLFSDKPVLCYKRYFTTALCLTSRVYTEVKKQELLNIEKQEELATSAVPSSEAVMVLSSQVATMSLCKNSQQVAPVTKQVWSCSAHCLLVLLALKM